VGYLRMPSWVLYNSKWNWRASLGEVFGGLVARGATDLVVDLRGNEGGSDVGDAIVGHLVAAPVPRLAVTRLVRYRRVPDDLKPYLDTWDPSFLNWGAAAIDSTDRFYRLRRDADDDLGGVITPALPRFTGRLWVLVGAANSSATFEFAQTVRQNHLGTLVGQPTGGNQRGINGGAFFFLRLPHSGLELDLPLIGQFPEGDRPDAGLQPDILVVPTVEDIARGRDAELDAVRARLRRSRVSPPSS
jgi:C-terminal processing protease CtpA/Prc